MSRIKISSSQIIQWIFLAIGLTALAIMIYKLGIPGILENIQKTGLWLIPIIGVWAIVYLMNTISAMIIIRDKSPESKNIKFLTLFKITISTFAINSSAPMGLIGGEPYKYIELKKYIGTTKATSSVILFTMMHFVSHFIFWIFSIFLAVVFSIKRDGWNIAFSVAFGICVLLIFLFFRGYRKGMVLNFFRLSYKIPFLKKGIRSFVFRKRKEIREIDNQIVSLHGENKKRFYTSLGVEFLARIVSCAEIYFIFIALGYYHSITYVYCILIVGFTSLFANILFFLPMQLGAREGGFMLIFDILKYSSVLAISVSLITRIRELFWMVVGFSLMAIKKLDHSVRINEISKSHEENVKIDEK